MQKQLFPSIFTKKSLPSMHCFYELIRHVFINRIDFAVYLGKSKHIWELESAMHSWQFSVSLEQRKYYTKYRSYLFITSIMQVKKHKKLWEVLRNSISQCSKMFLGRREFGDQINLGHSIYSNPLLELYNHEQITGSGKSNVSIILNPSSTNS